MNKLGALDASFLYLESPLAPMHIASVQVLDLPEGVSESEFVEQLKALLLERAHLIPYFRRKLRFVPFDIDHPEWVEDPNFRIDNHVKTMEVPAPGDRAALEATVARLHERRLDRNRPLWHLWVLTGLEEGRVALYNRAHHACLDGMAGQAMIETLMDPTPEPRQVPPPAPVNPERANRSLTGLLERAVENCLRYQLKQPVAALKALETGARLFQRAFDPRKGFGALADGAPRTRFNRMVSSRRAYAVGELTLDSVRTIAQTTGTKVNDVFLAVCAGGLRRYLARQRALPRAALVAGCPVSLRKPGDQSTNNQVTMMMVGLATDMDDPAERLQAVARSASVAKGFTQDIAPSYDTDVVLPGLPLALTAGARFAELTRALDLPFPRLPCNLVVSNVPGPQHPLYVCGARVRTHYPVSIPAHTQAVNITVQSYNGVLYFGITACARALPDADVLRDDLLAEFEVLKKLYVLPRIPPAKTERQPPLAGGMGRPPEERSSDRAAQAA